MSKALQVRSRSALAHARRRDLLGRFAMRLRRVRWFLRHPVQPIVAFARHPFPHSCLDCGFLAFGKHEVTRADRAVLGAKGSAGMPTPWESFNCRKSLWTSYDLNYAGDDFQGMMDEIHQSRRCEGFGRYRPGRTPERHIELEDQADQNSILGKIIDALLSKIGG